MGREHRRSSNHPPRWGAGSDKILNQALFDAALDGFDKSARVADEADAVEVSGLVSGERAVAGDDAGGGDAVTVAGGGPVEGAFILDLFAAHPVPGAEPT